MKRHRQYGRSFQELKARKEITDTVDRVFLRLSGHVQAPAVPVSTLNNLLQEENGDIGEPSSSSHRKRSFDDAEIHESGDADALADEPGKRSAIESSKNSGAHASVNRST